MNRNMPRRQNNKEKRMKRFSIIKCLFTIAAAMLATKGAVAQSGSVKKAGESVFTLTTFKKDGTILASSHGVFTGANGEAVSNLKPFMGAASAVVIDSKGNRRKVTRMIGANDLYDVARFRVEGNTKPAHAATVPAKAGDKLWLLPYSTKGAKPVQTEVKSVETFMSKYSYYIFSAEAPENMEACPFVNDNGQVAGLMQRSLTTSDINATDINFILSLTANALAVTGSTFGQIGIPVALPQGKDQATLALMLIAQGNDSTKYASMADDFIGAYPALVDGYAAKAQLAVEANDFDAARTCMENALKKVEAKDDAHYNYAKLIYMKETYKPEAEYKAWNMDKALQEATAAYSIRQLPLYKDLEGQILFGKGDYQKAYDTFMQLTGSSLKSGNLYYNAALCKQQMKAPDSEIIALLDSAVNNTDTLNIREAAKYFLMRGDTYNRMENYRQAVFDYTRYEVLNGGYLNAAFYYVREQAEVKAKLFKQALADIDHAAYLDPKEPTYLAEKASLQLRLNMFDEAIETSSKCIELAPDFSDSYLILGLAQTRKGNKAEGLANMQKAKDMGNAQAQPLIDKYIKK